MIDTVTYEMLKNAEKSGANLAPIDFDNIERYEKDIEIMAERVHQAYLDTCDKLCWPVKLENQVSYAELSEDSKELDRASVRAVLNYINIHTSQRNS